MAIEKQKIQEAIDADRIEGAIEMLALNIDSDPGNWEWPYMRGMLYWRTGNRAKAITDFEESASMSPSSPAAHMLEHVRGIMDFYNPDMLNP